MKNYKLQIFCFSALLLFCSSALHAQSCPTPSEFKELTTNNIRARFNTTGVHFLNGIEGGFEVPKGSGMSTISSGALWLGAKDEDNNLYVAAMIYGQNGNDYWTGPLSNNQVNTGAYYDRFWKVSKKEIDEHIAGITNQDPNYIMPPSIINWPAHGRGSFEESFLLAPYKNISSSNKYSPWFGDYPLIRGDEAIFWINNDVCGTHGESGGTPLGVEIMSMAYAFTSDDYALNHTIFLYYEIHNKSTRNYKDFYVGFFADFDICFPNDDYIGCDSLLNLCYGYKSEPMDFPWPTGPCDEYTPAQGAMFLNKKMNSFIYFEPGYSLIGSPTNANEFYNYLQGLWRNGTPLTYGGTGYNPTSTNYTKFAFSGDPATKTGWSEVTPNGPDNPPNNPGDRSGIMSAGPFNLKAGEKIKIDIALPFAHDLNGDHLTSVTMLKQNAQKIQEFYNDVILNIKKIEPKTGFLTVYPNPSNGQFVVSSNQNIKTIDFYDVMGRVQKCRSAEMQNGGNKMALDLSNLPKGLYMYRAVLEDNSVCSGKILVQ